MMAAAPKQRNNHAPCRWHPALILSNPKSCSYYRKRQKSWLAFWTRKGDTRIGK